MKPPAINASYVAGRIPKDAAQPATLQVLWWPLNAVNDPFCDKLMWLITYYCGWPNQKPRSGSYKSSIIMALNHVTSPIMEFK